MWYKHKVKQTVVEAWHWAGDKGVIAKSVRAHPSVTLCATSTSILIDADPPEECKIGDYILRDDRGEIHACSPEVFMTYYEKVEIQ